MNRIKPDVDIILGLLQETLVSYPTSKFIESLLYQYQERGSLSKKQLEGLHVKASNVKTIAPGKLATLEAIILKMPTRYKSPPAAMPQPPQKDINLQRLIDEILEKYPGHKRVLFFKMKYDNNDAVSSADRTEIEKFHKLLIK